MHCQVPFTLYNVPMMTEAAKKWQSDEYLIKRFGKAPRKVTKSSSNHFMVRALQHAFGGARLGEEEKRGGGRMSSCACSLIHTWVEDKHTQFLQQARAHTQPHAPTCTHSY